MDSRAYSGLKGAAAALVVALVGCGGDVAGGSGAVSDDTGGSGFASGGRAAETGGADPGTGGGDPGTTGGAGGGPPHGGESGTTGGGPVGDPCDGEAPPPECPEPGAAAPGCGDGVVNVEGEVCDDGNGRPGDGCNGRCQLEPNWDCPTDGGACEPTGECGNGALEAGEVCDDGSAAVDDGCDTCDAIDPDFACDDPDTACTRVVVCGDGRVNSVTRSGDEQCDDGMRCDDLVTSCSSPADCAGGACAPRSGDGCDADCQLEAGFGCGEPGKPCELIPGCGDGVLEVARGEACDDGNREPLDGCSASCLLEGTHTCPTPGAPCAPILAACGDGVVQRTLGESCDDGNAVGTDGCNDKCRLETGWACPLPGSRCAPICGDGRVRGVESCDDGEAAPDDGDGCSSTCQWEDGWACSGSPGAYTCVPSECGNGVQEGTEGCDDGNDRLGDGCTPLCQKEPTCTVGGGCTSACGDGLVVPPETCDDGNLRPGDGCSATCRKENGFECSQPPLGPSLDVPVVYRDFNASHPDFEPAGASNCGGMIQTGKLQPVLVNGRPKLAAGKTSSFGCWTASSSSSFDQWFSSAPGTNASVVGTMRLWDNGAGGYVNRWGADGEQWFTKPPLVWCGETTSGATCADCDFAYSECFAPCTPFHNTSVCAYPSAGGSYHDGTPVFYPVDALTSITPADQFQYAAIPDDVYDGGWELESPPVLHNFHFTSEVRFWFEYSSEATQVLSFTGDDDFWVFINGKLALDRGGIHSPVTGSIDIQARAAELSLVDGRVHEIAMFHAERMTAGSSYRLTLLGFNLEPTVCGAGCGDGQIGPGEQCDDGAAENTGGYGACQPDCTLGPRCGDGVEQSGEECDDGENLSDYGEPGCAPGCTVPPGCGDGGWGSCSEHMFSVPWYDAA